MPWPDPGYTGGQDDDRTRSIDVVHIEPSIREGVHLLPSLYGSDASRPIHRFPPKNTVAPFLIGDSVIPGVVTCALGQWIGSPTPLFAYQWMADGVDLPGENNQTLNTTSDLDGKILSCEVRGYNYIGEDYAFSNTLGVSLIEPQEVREAEFHFITGLHANQNQTMLDARTMMISGIGTDNRLDVNRGVTYWATGIGALHRKDVNEMRMPVITGLEAKSALTALGHEGIAVISLEDGRPLVDSVRQLMPLKNWNAELGHLGWTQFGELHFNGVDPGYTPPVEGAFSFSGGLNVHPEGKNTPYTYQYQNILMWDRWLTDIDAGTCHLECEWLQALYSQAGEDQANVRVEFYAGDGITLIGSNNGAGLSPVTTDVWFPRSFECPIPALTRFVRIYVEWLWDPLSGDNDSKGQIDQVRSYIRKGAKVSYRDFTSPDRWRIRFTQANGWSGGAVSELELRATPGGADLCTGGTVLFGSAGLGVTNADAAFDDSLDTNYWAGDENSITEGTSWIGYEKATPWRPEQIALTARPGSAALQMGQSFDLEASEDGIRWDVVERWDFTRVERFWNSGETRFFDIATGAVPYITDGTNFPAPTMGRKTNYEDDYPLKGIVFQSFARMDLTHIRLCVANQTFDYRWQVVRVSDVKSSSYYFGTVIESFADGLESVIYDGANPNTSFNWVEMVLPSTFELDVGEYFAIIFIDHDIVANQNPLDTDEGRLALVTDWNDPNSNSFDLRRPFVRRLDSWIDGDRFTLFEVGDQNHGPIQSGLGVDYGIDFKGTIF